MQSAQSQKATQADDRARGAASLYLGTPGASGASGASGAELPSKKKWSAAQLAAIEIREKNLLVSAAAGSGKTAVLIERVIRLLREGEQLREMLIVTFTKAAAAELRARLFESALTAATDGDALLAEQISWIDQADIRTLHSFCAQIIRAHFQSADVDPTFRTLDPSQAAELRELALRDALIEWYSGENPDALALAQCREPGDNADDAVQLYDFLTARPQPWSWFNAALGRIPTDAAALFESDTIRAHLASISWKMQSSADSFDRLSRMISKYPGGAPFARISASDAAQCRALAIAANGGCGAQPHLVRGGGAEPRTNAYAAYSKACGAFKWATKPRAKTDDEREASIIFSSIRDPIKKRVDNERETAVYEKPPDEHVRDAIVMKSQINAIADLTRMFDTRYDALKEERACLDYSDLEQRALRALDDPLVAQCLRERYAHIFVDEYQDSTPLQEALLQKITRGRNLFLVGDVKQSIYRFRDADPTLFLEKYLKYPTLETAAENDDCLRINLDRNYRSTPEILDAVNGVFSRIQRTRTLGIDYDESASMKPGLEYYSKSAVPELHIIMKSNKDNTTTEGDAEDGDTDGGGEDMTAVESEAAWAALRIREICAGAERSSALDEGLPGERKYRYGDIAILMRAASGRASRVAEILRLNGIPAAASENDAFFEQVEILQIIDILKALDNPLVDLPLVGALSGPALGLDEAALARVRMCDREGGWYDALQAAAESGDELGIACRAFLERLANWRVRAAMRPVDETICEICEETAFFSTIGASEGGRARQANIRSLTELAAQYERETGGGLHGFLKAIDRMANEGRQGAAGAADADAVRILTIHASKGLQYPVVILLGMGTRFNREDEHGTMLLNHKQGVAMQIFNAENMTRRIPIFIKAVAAGITRETIEEEARILYVGMTRAQERLLVYGSISNPEKYIGETEDDEDGAIAEYEIVNAVSAIEWIILSLRGRPEMNVIRSALGGMADARGADEGGARLFRVSVHSQRPPGVLIHSRSDADDANADDNFNYDLLTDDMSSGEGGYKFIEIPECESRRYKRSVTEITHAGLSGGELIPERPLFAGAAAAAAEVGSAVHAVLSRLDLARLRSEEHRLVVGDTIRRMVELNLLVGESRIDIDRILKFFEHPLGGRVIWANEIKREWPFNYVPPEEPGTLIQGVIDCCFISGGGWTLIDYKTDRVRVLGELVDRYRAQVELYSRALEAITQRPVLERGIYSFTLGDVIFI